MSIFCEVKVSVILSIKSVYVHVSYSERFFETQLFHCTVAKHPTIRNSAHRKPSTVLFNISSGTAIAEAVTIQHINTVGICKDVRYFAQLSYNVTTSS